MLFTSVLTVASAIAGVTAAPYKIPSTDGFPNPSPAQLKLIEKLAGGTLPNGALPTSLKQNGITTLQLIATNELFEVAYFSDLLDKVVKGDAGYTPADLAPLKKAYVVKTLSAVVAQEKLHAIGANAILTSAKQNAIAPCSYTFPKNDFKGAITLANTFTDVVLGVLPEAQAGFAADAGDESGLVPLVGSIIGQEGEQNGFYRFVQKKVPSAAPFLTGGSPSFAFTAIQQFIVPNSCPTPLNTFKGLTTFGALNVLTKPIGPKTGTLGFSVKGKVDCKTESIAYISGQNVPVTVPILSSHEDKGVTYLTASFPFEKDGFANGLTIAALVKGTAQFPTNDAVAAATLNGPGLIEVN